MITVKLFFLLMLLLSLILMAAYQIYQFAMHNTVKSIFYKILYTLPLLCLSFLLLTVWEHSQSFSLFNLTELKVTFFAALPFTVLTLLYILYNCKGRACSLSLLRNYLVLLLSVLLNNPMVSFFMLTVIGSLESETLGAKELKLRAQIQIVLALNIALSFLPNHYLFLPLSLLTFVLIVSGLIRKEDSFFYLIALVIQGGILFQSMQGIGETNLYYSIALVLIAIILLGKSYLEGNSSCQIILAAFFILFVVSNYSLATWYLLGILMILRERVVLTPLSRVLPLLLFLPWPYTHHALLFDKMLVALPLLLILSLTIARNLKDSINNSWMSREFILSFLIFYVVFNVTSFSLLTMLDITTADFSFPWPSVIVIGMIAIGVFLPINESFLRDYARRFLLQINLLRILDYTLSLESAREIFQKAKRWLQKAKLHSRKAESLYPHLLLPLFILLVLSIGLGEVI